jgi:hypothetical protein
MSLPRGVACLALVLILWPAAARAQQKPAKPKSAKEWAGPALTLTEGKFGKALDARRSAVEVAGVERFRQTPLTAECWARLFGKDGFNVLVACDPKTSSRHWEIYTCARTGFFSAYLPGVEPAEVRSGVDVCDGAWHHLAMVHDGKSVNLYVDGKRVKEQAVRPKAGGKPEPGPLTIGMALTGAGSGRIGCDGLIDEVRLTGGERAITAAPTKPPALDGATIGLWRFDDPHEEFADPAWTPRPLAGDVPAHWKHTDKDWIDPRFREMDTGPFLDATVEYPLEGKRAKCFKGTAIRLGDKGELSVLFDRCQLRYAAGWSGGYLLHSDRRFGLLNTPKPAGELQWTTHSGPGWANPRGEWMASHPPTAPLPQEWAHFRGLTLYEKRVVLSYTVGETAVLDFPWAETDSGLTAFTRSLELVPGTKPRTVLVAELPGEAREETVQGVPLVVGRQGDDVLAVALAPGSDKATFRIANGGIVHLELPAVRQIVRVKLLQWHGKAANLAAFARLVKTSPGPYILSRWARGGPPRWTETIATRGEVALDEAPYVIDTLTVPYKNPYRALFFLSGVDFLPDGTLAVCTLHGDVWLVKGADAKLERLTWKRFATGLYQPLGLKVVDGRIIVLERGQLTRLHDLNGDGEADFYECFCNDWHTGAGEHSFDTCLETDPQGRFYFFKTGDPDTPTGGCLLRTAKDGSAVEVFATGFRHPIGLSASPDGLILGADQEGNWMPSTRVDVYRKGGFYGDMRTHHRATPPKIYDGPLCWLPRELDNSAGGQVWVPPGTFGPLGGKPLHFSYGACRAILLLMQQLDGPVDWQGGGVDLGWEFLSGVFRGRFGPDGHLYAVGTNGWQTAARADGCLQRVRYTGKPVRLPTELSVHADGIRLGFSCKLDPARAADPRSYRIERWNYRWREDYGSKRWSVAEPERVGQDPVPIRKVRLLPDGRSVFLEVAGLAPVMQMELRYDVKAADGAAVRGLIDHTIHELAKPLPR